MKSHVTSALAIVALALVVCVGTSGTARADGLVANWTLNDGGAVGNTIGAGATIADSSGNGFTGTVVGGDTLQSMPGVIGNGLYFSGDDSPNYSYISVPATLGNGASLGGMNSLTISLWLNVPAASCNQAVKMAVDLYDTGDECYEVGTQYNPLFTSMRGMLYGFNGPPLINDYWNKDPSGNQGFWNRTDGTGWTANTWEQVTVEYYGGTSVTAIGFSQYYVNGIFVAAEETGLPYPQDGPKPIPPPAAGQTLAIGCANSTTYSSGAASPATQMWYGGLNDIGVWKTNLTGVMTFPQEIADFSAGLPASEGATGGEVTALYQTPMYNNHTGALSQYGVSAMDQLFTIYDSASATPIAVTTANGTLGWKYVPSGLSVGSGYAGQLAGGEYVIQLDANGGGVESLLPGDANGDGTVDINDLTIVLAHYGQTGTSWASGEFTGDGTVDINDLTIVLANYGQTDGSSAIGLSAVPEPGAMAILAAGAAGLLACAWRRRRQHCPPAGILEHRRWRHRDHVRVGRRLERRWHGGLRR